MALSFKDGETDRLARRVASLTGETLTEVVRVALAERLAREQSKRGKPSSVMEEVDEIVSRYDALPVLDSRSPEEILGYDENGLPT